MSDQECPPRTVTALRVYPIKGCRAIEARSLMTTPTGFAFDRQWVVVQQRNHRFITQRNFQRLSLIQPELPDVLLSGGETHQDLTLDMNLTIKFPVAAPVQVPLIPQTSLQKREITVCEWTGMALDEGQEVAEKLSEFLETPVRLFRFIEKYNPSWNLSLRAGYSREVDKNFASGFGTQFSDGFPFLVINESSLIDLNHRIGRELPSNRFRPNIIVLGRGCWEEDNWREIRIFDPSDEDCGECRLSLVKPCKRCKVTTVDQSTAYLDFEPLFTLSELHNGVTTGFSKVLPDCSHSAFFGWNAVSTKNGRISVGDTVEVLIEGRWSSSKTTSSMFAYLRHQLFKLTK